MVSPPEGRWDIEYGGPLNVQAVRERFQPPSHFRIGSYRYPSGTRIHGSMQASRCFVLRGECRYEFDAGTTTLACGEFADLPAGSYLLEVGGADEVEIVLCWELPPDIRGEN